MYVNTNNTRSDQGEPHTTCKNNIFQRIPMKYETKNQLRTSKNAIKACGTTVNKRSGHGHSSIIIIITIIVNDLMMRSNDESEVQ